MTHDTTEYLFSYGTLRYPAVQRETFGRLLRGQDDSMIGYIKEWVEITDPEVLRASGQDKHPIVRYTGQSDDRIDGTVFEITAKELALADAYEVDDYQRVDVTLKSGQKAWVYVEKPT